MPLSAPVRSVSGRTGAVVLVKADVGLTNVNDTSDAAKPISTATQTALDAKLNAANGTASGITLTGNINITGNPVFNSGSVKFAGTGSSGPLVQWYNNGDQQWQDKQNFGVATKILYDFVNAKNHVIYTAGAGAGGGTTELNSALTVAGATTLSNAVANGVGYQVAGVAWTVAISGAANRGIVVRGDTAQTAMLQQWQDINGAVRARVDPNGYFTSGDGVSGGAQYVLNTPTGGNAYIIWNVAGAQKWYDQVPGSTGVRIMYDAVNAKNHVTLTAGAGAGAGTTELNSALKVAGNVGFYGAAAAAKGRLDA